MPEYEDQNRCNYCYFLSIICSLYQKNCLNENGTSTRSSCSTSHSMLHFWWRAPFRSIWCSAGFPAGRRETFFHREMGLHMRTASQLINDCPRQRGLMTTRRSKLMGARINDHFMVFLGLCSVPGRLVGDDEGLCLEKARFNSKSRLETLLH